MAVTQLQERRAPRTININGIDYVLRKDALSSDNTFPYDKMVWLGAGSTQVLGVWSCWIVGIIPPAQGSLENPVSVFALGFSDRKMVMSPAMISPMDMQRMHYYVASTDPFVDKFVNKFLGIEPATAGEQSRITPYPEVVNGRDSEVGAQAVDSVDGSNPQ